MTTATRQKRNAILSDGVGPGMLSPGGLFGYCYWPCGMIKNACGDGEAAGGAS